MQRRRMVLLAGTVIVVLVASPGCVTKKLFRKNVEQTDSRVAGVESAVEENERRISDLSEETDSKIAAVEGRVEEAVEVSGTALSRAEEASVQAEKAARGRLLWTVTLSDDAVKFPFDQATISPEGMQDLDELAAKVKSLGKAIYLEIEGHTDSIGSEGYNIELGEKRAMAALKYMSESGGIPLHAMNAISYGAARPVADNGTPGGRAQNRRVVIRVLE